MAKEHYKRYDSNNRRNLLITPEFNLMSRGGRKGKGIAATWLETYKDDVYPHDYVIMNGQKLKPPRYYDNQLAASDQIGAILMKLEREFSARSQEADNTPKRLAAKEKVAQAKLNLGKKETEMKLHIVVIRDIKANVFCTASVRCEHRRIHPLIRG